MNDTVAKYYFLSFAEVCSRLLVLEGQYDAVIAPGNSGVVMAGLLHCIIDALDLTALTTIQLATFHDANRVPGTRTRLIDDTSSGILVLQELVLTFGQPIRRVLLVDDEIGSGETVKACLAKVNQILPSNAEIEYTVIAQPRENFTGFDLLNVKFEPYASDLDASDTNVIRKYFLRTKLQPIAILLESHHQDKFQALNVALNVPTKENAGNGVQFTSARNVLCANNLPHFVELQRDIRQDIKQMLRKMI